jgi:hypothetical protein
MGRMGLMRRMTVPWVLRNVLGLRGMPCVLPHPCPLPQGEGEFYPAFVAVTVLCFAMRLVVVTVQSPMKKLTMQLESQKMAKRLNLTGNAYD